MWGIPIANFFFLLIGGNKQIQINYQLKDEVGSILEQITIK